jgi:hypothetical protein
VAVLILIAAIVSGYVRPIRPRGSDWRDHDPIRVMLLIKKSANRVLCRRLFFHLSAQIDGSATNSGFCWWIGDPSRTVAESFGSSRDGMQLADRATSEGRA